MTKIVNLHRRKAAMILLMLFLVFSIASYKQEADAFAFAIPAELAIAVCAGLLISAGVVFLQTGDLRTAATAFYTNAKTQVDLAIAAGHVIWNGIEQQYKYVTTAADDLWATVKAWVDANYNVGEQVTGDTITTTTLTVSTTTLYSLVNPTSYYTVRSNSSSVYYSKVHVEGTLLVADVYYVSNNAFYRRETVKSGITGPVHFIHSSPGTLQFKYDDGISFYSISYGTSAILNICAGITTNTNVIGETGIVDNPEYDWDNERDGTRSVGIPLLPGVGTGTIEVPTATGTTAVTVPDTAVEEMVGDTPADVKAQDNTGAIVDTVTLAETGVTDYPGDKTTEDETKTSMRFLLFTKFPFCIPWDLYNAMKLIAATPEAPHWEFDLLSGLGAGWVGKMIIDVDMSKYETVGTVIRWTETISFCFMLIIGTKKMIWK